MRAPTSGTRSTARAASLTAVVGIDDEVRHRGSAVFQVWTDGVKKYDSGLMTGAMAGTSINVNVTGATELALIITDGGDGNGGDHGDWADAQVTCGADTTAPTVTATSPVAGATGVAVTANVTATFSEAMNAATLTTTTVTLVPQGSTTPVAATVTYAAATNTVTLNPTANLATNTLYTATIKGGAAGAKDVAGNAAGRRQGLDVHDQCASHRHDQPAPRDAEVQGGRRHHLRRIGDGCRRWPPARHEPELEHRAPSLPRRHLPQPSVHEPARARRGPSPRRTTAIDVYFEIKLTATDSAGLSGTVSVNIQPETVQFTLETSPRGLQVVFGGLSAAAPVTYTVIAGSTHTIFAPSPQGGSTFLRLVRRRRAAAQRRRRRDGCDVCGVVQRAARDGDERHSDSPFRLGAEPDRVDRQRDRRVGAPARTNSGCATTRPERGRCCRTMVRPARRHGRRRPPEPTTFRPGSARLVQRPPGRPGATALK